MSTTPADDESGLDTPAAETVTGTESGAPTQEQLDRFPVLFAVLDEYLAQRDRSQALIEKYQRTDGEASEFVGLSDELLDAIKTPLASTPVVNAALGTALTRAEARSMLSDFRDQLLQRGEFSAEYQEEERRERREERRNSRPTTEELLSHYALRKITVPFVPWFRDRAIPLVAFLGGGVALLLVGILLGQAPWPGWLSWFPLFFLSLGVVVAGATIIAMVVLRGEMLNPESEEEYRARQEFKASRAEKREARATSKAEGSRTTLAERARSLFR